ncbi:MAG: hypothetical protein DRJ15_10025 [Bacteroidetes bacterium]|nr:MAG: hypothetical protein DRJ15_10025 [Bacteroidota bacterium]
MMSAFIHKKLSGIALLVLIFIAGCSYSQDKMQENYLHMRMEMVRKQIEARGIRDKKVLDAMKRVERHHFVPDGYEGWPEHAPFDAIIVTCAPTHIPPALEYQLSEGGRMIIPTGNEYNQELILLIKENGELNQKDVIPVRFVPMIRENGKPY